MLPSIPNVPEKELRELKRRVALMLQQEDPERFPGSQPVSFERKHLEAPDPSQRGVSLRSKAFYAAEKTDGVRYMLLVLADATYAVDRNFAMKQLPKMHFPSREGAPLDKTLLDGELVEDEVATGTFALRFLAYDACCINGRSVLAEPLPKRLMCLRRDVLSPRYRAAQAGHDFSSEAFMVEQKDFFSMPQLPHIFGHVATADHGAKYLYAFSDPLRKLQHGNDGIIFTP